MTAPTVRRPGLVTVIVVLTVISGIGSIIAGIVAMIAFGGFFSPGLILLLLGLVYLAVAKGLADGNNLSRTVVAVVSVLQILFAVITLFTANDAGTRNTPIGSAIISLIILAILYSAKANAFFGSRR